MSTSAAKAREQGWGDDSAHSWLESRPSRKAPGPVPHDRLCAEAKRALDDFGYFQLRYFGRIAVPWQVEAAAEIVQLLRSPNEEYVVINAPPGSGKSTTFVLDIPAWVTCQDRQIRGLIGSRTQTQAKWYIRRLKTALSRTLPAKADAKDLALGLAVDAVATLCDDFGVFKTEGEQWTDEAFIVAQLGGVPVDEKESTWQSFGMDSGFLGGRFNITLWDDVVDLKTMKTVEAQETQQTWWDDTAETRLEPAGLGVLQGQRLGAGDLYRYNLDKKASEGEGDDDVDGTDQRELSGRKYHHIVFKAHYEDRCRGKESHRLDALPYPDGCLLYPRRLPWRKLQGLMANRNDKFRVLYQQEDVDPAAVLVNPLWVSGGVDPKTGVEYPGCWDRDRDICEIPHGLAGQLLSVATCDPSPTKFWAVEWWVVRCDGGQAHERYLMDLHRAHMDAPDFLDWDQRAAAFCGLMEEWQARSRDLGLPIVCWIVEANAAQRFLLQYDHVKRWQAAHSVDVVPHQTQRNKADSEYGVQSIAPHWQYGRVRLPGKGQNTGWASGGQGWITSMKLVDEVTRWPDGRTDDAVMAEWFLEWRLPSLIPSAGSLPRDRRPSWLAQADTYNWRQMAYG